MKVKKIINNNVALVDRGGHESIIYLTGVVFKKKVGQHISDSEVEKTFVLDSQDRLEHFSYLLSRADDQLILLVNELVQYGEKEIGKSANDYLYLALLDHLSFALKRAKKDQYLRSPLTWEVKKFYPSYYKIGLEALERINQTFQVDFPEDEAVAIALHFVNLQETKAKFDEQLADMETLRDMLNIIKYHFTITLD
jgi:beta-glucoside operon transcriptional antiterminator